MEIAALLVADLAGVAVFAASGASAAVVKRLDLVIGQVPPLAFDDWRYGAVAVVTAIAVFYLHPQLARLRRIVLVLDAAGLALFTVTGTLKALAAGVGPVGACVIGMLTGIGGGLVRDLLLGRIPVVLRREIYAVASLMGAVAVAVLEWLGAGGPLPLTAAAALVFAIRIVALRRRWAPPVPTDPHPGPSL